MIIIRDLFDVETLERNIKRGDVLDIYCVPYDISKIYFNYRGMFMTTLGSEGDAEYCSSGEFHADLRIALLDPNRYFIKLVTDTEVDVVIMEEGAVI
jgi:hypothetical protein